MVVVAYTRKILGPKVLVQRFEAKVLQRLIVGKSNRRHAHVTSHMGVSILNRNQLPANFTGIYKISIGLYIRNVSKLRSVALE